MHGYRDLIVWQKSMEMVTAIYAVTEAFPKQETYGLSSQIKRAAVSVPSNIAEGYRRRGKKEREQFYFIALGSAAEVETQLELAKRLHFVTNSSAQVSEGLLDEISKILYKLTTLTP